MYAQLWLRHDVGSVLNAASQVQILGQHYGEWRVAGIPVAGDVSAIAPKSPGTSAEVATVTTATCTHFWKIHEAHGKTSRGECQLCGEAKEFKNTIPEVSGWQNKVAWLKAHPEDDGEDA